MRRRFVASCDATRKPVEMVDIAKREPARECAADQKGDRAKVG